MKISVFAMILVALAACAYARGVSRIIEGPTYYIAIGSTVNLTCVINESTSPPVNVFWYHEGNEINADRVNTENNGNATASRLHISSARHSDSGAYTCKPTNTDPAYIRVYVLDACNYAAGEEYHECGTACPLTCDNNGEVEDCTSQCVTGCFCQHGTVRRSADGHCVLPEEC